MVMRRCLAALLAIAAAGCSDERPPAPTAAEGRALNDTEAMLDALANDAGREEGPEAKAPDPSNVSNAEGLD
jgi:hypothetical protein